MINANAGGKIHRIIVCYLCTRAPYFEPEFHIVSSLQVVALDTLLLIQNVKTELSLVQGIISRHSKVNVLRSISNSYYIKENRVVECQSWKDNSKSCLRVPSWSLTCSVSRSSMIHFCTVAGIRAQWSHSSFKNLVRPHK